MTEQELMQKIKDAVEDVVGSITDVQVKQIEDAVIKKFAELQSNWKPVGSDNTDTEEPKFKSIGEQLQAVYKSGLPGNDMDVRLKAASGMNETIGAEGGFLLQPTFSTELIRNATETGVVYKKCRKIPISGNSNSLVLYGVDETSRINGSRWGGIQIYFSDEAGTVTATKPKWRQMNLKLKKMMGICYATDELLQDTSALSAWISQAFTDEMSFKMDDQVIRGTGAGQSLGILNSPAFVSQAKETNQVAATVVFENILNMWNRMPARNRMKAEWYINQDVETQLYQMYLAAGTGGIPVYLPPGGVSNAQYSTLMGRPVIPIEQCEALGTVGDIILADMSEYLIIDKNGMAADTSVHVRFLYDEQTFRFTYRMDGQPLWHAALTAYKGFTSRSPYVGLATRS